MFGILQYICDVSHHIYNCFKYEIEKALLKVCSFHPEEGRPLTHIHPESFHMLQIFFKYYHLTLKVSPCYYFTTFGIIRARYYKKHVINWSPLSQGRRFWENITYFVSQFIYQLFKKKDAPYLKVLISYFTSTLKIDL